MSIELWAVRLERPLTAEEAEKIAFGNFHRLLRQVLG